MSEKSLASPPSVTSASESCSSANDSLSASWSSWASSLADRAPETLCMASTTPPYVGGVNGENSSCVLQSCAPPTPGPPMVGRDLLTVVPGRGTGALRKEPRVVQPVELPTDGGLGSLFVVVVCRCRCSLLSSLFVVVVIVRRRRRSSLSSLFIVVVYQTKLPQSQLD